MSEKYFVGLSCLFYIGYWPKMVIDRKCFLTETVYALLTEMFDQKDVKQKRVYFINIFTPKTDYHKVLRHPSYTMTVFDLFCAINIIAVIGGKLITVI